MAMIISTFDSVLKNKQKKPKTTTMWKFALQD